MKYIKIAFRNLDRQKKRNILLGICIGFCFLILVGVSGVLTGFISNLHENFSYLAAGQIYIEGMQKTAKGKTFSIISEEQLIKNAITEAGIKPKYLVKRSGTSADLIFAGNTYLQGIQGISWDEETYIRERLKLKEGDFESIIANPNSLIISEAVATKLKVKLGDRIVAKFDTATGQAEVGEFDISGIALDSGFLGSMSAYAHQSHLNKLLGLAPSDFQQLSIFLDKNVDVNKATAKLHAALSAKAQVFERKAQANLDEEAGVMSIMSGAQKEKWEGVKYQITNINDILSIIETLKQGLNTIIFVIIVILFLVVMIGIINTFRMIMYERIREIGTMRAIGMQRGGVALIFILESFFLTLMSCAGGMILAFLIGLGFSLKNFGTDSPLFFMLKNGHMSFIFNPMDVIFYLLAIAVLTFLAVLYPALKAAYLKPAEALGKTY